MKRQYKQEEYLNRAHKVKLRRIRALCETLKVELYPYENAPADAICVLSTNDYDIGEPARACSSDKSAQSYFVVDKADTIIETLYY